MMKFKDSNYTIRPIEERDNASIAEIVRCSLAAYGLDIPGTAYFDPHLDTLSLFYDKYPSMRRYNVLTDREGNVIGGCGVAEFSEGCCELQKLYVTEEHRCKGLGKRLMLKAEEDAKDLGYRQVYLETHSNLADAMNLYERNGYSLIEKPVEVAHDVMNRFYIKDL